MTITVSQVEQFLYKEARYLDDKEWDLWLEMYDTKAEFWVPSWDDDGELISDPRGEISLMYYANRDGLEDRVFRINTEKSSASSIPEPRTSHSISNIEMLEVTEDHCKVRFNWINHSYRHRKAYSYFGTSYYTLVGYAEKLKISSKKVVIKNDYLNTAVDIYCL